MSTMADSINNKVIERLPEKEKELLRNAKTGRQEQRVKNSYYVYNTPYNNFGGMRIDFFVKLGKLQGVQKVQVKESYQNRLVNIDYDSEKARKRNAARRRKIKQQMKKKK